MFVAGLGHPSSKEGRADMLVGDMEISKMMVYVQHVEEKKVKDREEYQNTKAEKQTSCMLLIIAMNKRILYRWSLV